MDLEHLGRNILNLAETHSASLYIVGALLLGIFVGFRWASGAGFGYRRSFQNSGEELLSIEIQENFAPPDYHLMNHVTVRIGDGTTQIDHILISKAGVFVIETKDFRGWIFASRDHEYWTQVLFHKKSRFQNPIHQNARHVRAVRELLDFLPPETVQSAVVFTGDADFKTEMPNGVFTIEEFLEHVHQQTTEVMTANRMQFCVGRLETNRLSITHETDVEHVEYLQRRYPRKSE